MTELKDHSLKTNTLNPTGADTVELVSQMLAKMDESELVQVRNILEELQPTDLEKLDLNAELALQFRQAKALQAEVQKDATTPPNQKAQIFNTVRAQLGDIIKQQESVWSMERLKTFETALLKAANAMTEEARDLFFDLYSKHLPGGTMCGLPVGEIGAPAPAEPAP